jgi:hypothetical protein
MAVQIGAKPDSGFDDPIGMLTDCHRRIERFLGILCKVIQGAGRRNLTEEEKSAVQAAVHYFQQGGQWHSSDEEESLFPRLRGKLIPAVESIAQLQSEHRKANRLHNSIEHFYLSWISSGTLSSEDENQLLSETKQQGTSMWKKPSYFRMRRKHSTSRRLQPSDWNSAGGGNRIVEVGRSSGFAPPLLHRFRCVWQHITRRSCTLKTRCS